MLSKLKDAVTVMHACDCSHSSTARVHESFEGETVWKGTVEIFELHGHPKAQRAYAWSYEDDNGALQHVAVLEIPPVANARDAVQVAIASGQIK